MKLSSKTKPVRHLLTGILILAAFLSCSPSPEEQKSRPENTIPELERWQGSKDYKSPISLPERTNQSQNLNANWWKESAFYHIWIKSFKDTDCNDCSLNCGDFKGIEDSLEYIQKDLGCDAIWLSPFFDCWYKENTNSKSAKINMYGYDVNDFYKVNPYFGCGDGSNAEKELESLINACHERGMKIIFDFIPNHTSHENQWFIDSLNGKNGKEGWYMWSTNPPDWKNTWGAKAWHKKNGRYYYAAFADTQPDLNFRNYEVREEMKNVVRYWLNKGFDGLRVDAVRYLIETGNTLQDTKETHEWFAELRKVIDEYESPKFMACEAWIENNRTALEKYFGTADTPEFNMVLDFDQGKAVIEEVLCEGTDIYYNNSYKYSTVKKIYANPASDKSFGTFLGNHDEYFDRPGDWFKGEKAPAILATSLSLLRPTVPFIYYGNELAQPSGSQGGDFKLRQPFDWFRANEQKNTPDSLLNVNKAILALRSSESYRALFSDGTIRLINHNMIYTDTQKPWNHTRAYTIANDSQKLLVVANLTKYNQENLYFLKSDIDLTSYSLLIGNKDTNTAIETNDNEMIFHNFSPYEIRVYDLSAKDKETVLDVWDFQ